MLDVKNSSSLGYKLRMPKLAISNHEHVIFKKEKPKNFDKHLTASLDKNYIEIILLVAMTTVPSHTMINNKTA